MIHIYYICNIKLPIVYVYIYILKYLIVTEILEVVVNWKGSVIRAFSLTEIIYLIPKINAYTFGSSLLYLLL